MKGGEKMNISKVYYEELKSKCVNGKWESVRIGAEVSLIENESPEYCLSITKDFVRTSMNKELGENKDIKLLKESLDEIRKIAQSII